MADQLYNEVTEEGAKKAMDLVDRFEQFLISLLDKYVANETDKYKNELQANAVGIGRKELDKYIVIEAPDADETTLEALFAHYNIEKYKITKNKKGELCVAVSQDKKTRTELELLLDDVKNKSIDFDKVKRDYISKYNFKTVITPQQKDFINQ